MLNSFVSKIAYIVFFATILPYPVMGDDKATTLPPEAKEKTQVMIPILEFNYLQPRTYLLEDIQVVGAQSIDAEVLIAISGLRLGDLIQIPGPLIKGAIEKLWKQKLVKEVSMYATRVVDNRLSLAIHIVESPRLSSYTFEGVTKREKKTLADKVNLVPGKIIRPKLMQNLKKNIKQHFIDLGYRDIVVEITTIPDPLDAAYAQLRIKIDKGEKTIINKILITGNNQLKSDLLKSMLQLQEKRRFTLVKDVLYKICTLQPIRKGGLLWHCPDLDQTIVYLKSHVIFTSSKFMKAKYVADKKRLIEYYQSQGYRDVAIVKEKVYKVKKGLLNIAFQIKEGEKYYIRNIKWVGNYLHTAQALNKVLRIQPGSVYSTSLLKEKLYHNPVGKDVSSMYMNDGYLFFHVEPVEVGIEGNQVDLELRIHEGKQATINQITIGGNHYTNESVIRRELKVFPGEKFSRAKLIRSQRELVMLNIFDPAKMEVVPSPNAANNTVDLFFKVKESPRFDAKLGASLAQQNIAIYVDLGTNNFSLANALRWKLPIGDLQIVQFRVAFTGKHSREFTLKFVEPWLTGKKPTSLDFSISQSFHEHQDEKQASSDATLKNSDGSDQGERTGYLSSFSIKAGLGKRLTWPDDYCTGRTGLTYQTRGYKKYDILGDGKLFTDRSHEVCLNIMLERNTLDQPTYPTSGSVVTLQSKMTPPYSWFLHQPTKKVHIVDQLKRKEYIQVLLELGKFYNLLGDWVINIFANGGVVTSYSPTSIGPFERFAMGGTDLVDNSLLGKELVSLRGYPREYINPKDQGGYEGGVLFNKVGLELRHPIIKSSMFFVYALLFAEAGNTWARYKDWQLWDLKRSLGLGLRFYLPIGLIGLDWGFGVDSRNSERLEVHWSLGGSSR